MSVASSAIEPKPVNDYIEIWAYLHLGFPEWAYRCNEMVRDRAAANEDSLSFVSKNNNIEQFDDSETTKGVVREINRRLEKNHKNNFLNPIANYLVYGGTIEENAEYHRMDPGAFKHRLKMVKSVAIDIAYGKVYRR